MTISWESKFSCNIYKNSSKKYIKKIIYFLKQGCILYQYLITQLSWLTTKTNGYVVQPHSCPYCNITCIKTETFMHQLYNCLQTIQDTPRIDDFSALVEKQSNSLLNKAIVTLLLVLIYLSKNMEEPFYTRGWGR